MGGEGGRQRGSKTKIDSEAKQKRGTETWGWETDRRWFYPISDPFRANECIKPKTKKHNTFEGTINIGNLSGSCRASAKNSCNCIIVIKQATNCNAVVITKNVLFLFGGHAAALQVGRSRVRFPILSLEIFIDIILPAALWPWGRLSL